MSAGDQRFATINLFPGISISVSGGTAGPNFSNLLLMGPSAVISPQDEKDCRTTLAFEIPSGVFNSPEVVEINGARLTFRLRQRSIGAIGDNLLIDDFTELARSLLLKPDSKGRTCVTSVQVETSEYVQLSHLQGLFLESNETAHSTIRPLIKSLGINAISYVNEFIDIYCLATNNKSLQRVSVSDVVRLEAWQTLGGNPTLLNYIAVMMPFGSSITFNASPTADPTQKDLIERHLRIHASLDGVYRIAKRSMAEAHRSLDSTDYAMACFHANKACEEAANYFVKSCEKSSAVKLEKKTALKRARKLSGKPGRIYSLLNYEVPAICGDRADYPKNDVKLCDDLRIARNDASHDIRAFRRKHKHFDLSAQVEAASRYIDYLISVHPS